MGKPMKGVLPPQWSTSAQELKHREINAWSEKQFQDNVIALAKSLGFTLIYHTHDSRRSQPGFPDLVLVNPSRGITLWRELKSARGRISAAQQQWIEGLKNAGHDAGYWRPEDWATERIHAELRGVASA